MQCTKYPVLNTLLFTCHIPKTVPQIQSGTGLGRVDSSPMILGRVWRLALSDFAFTDLSSSFLNSLVTCGDLQDNPLL